jgi:hypothetical protein
MSSKGDPTIYYGSRPLPNSALGTKGRVDHQINRARRGFRPLGGVSSSQLCIFLLNISFRIHVFYRVQGNTMHSDIQDPDL